jgi:acetolactate synthase-1/2/3 large subunit
MVVNGGALFAKALKKEGVEQIFTICGGQIMPLIYGCRAEGIAVIDVRHENAGVYAADAYARMTGKPGVVVATVTPGVLQTMQGIAEARAANTPLILIAASVGLGDYDTGAEQDFDTYNILKTNTIWSAKIYDTKRIPEYVSKAFRQALASEPGPVYLECPVNIMKGKVEELDVDFPELTRTLAQPFGDPELIDQAAEMLINAKSPVMVVGDTCVYTSRYGEAIRELAHYLDIPVYATTIARGAFGDEDDDLFAIGEGALAEADVVLTFSVNMNFRMNFGKPPMVHEEAKFIQVHPNITKIGFNAPAHIGIVAGAGAGAKQILEAVLSKTVKKANPAWVKKATELHAALRQEWTDGYNYKDIKPMHPAKCSAEVAKFLAAEGKDWSIACDGGDAYEWIMRAVKVHRPGQIVGYGANGTIGTGQGFAMGAWLAHKKPVLLYTGDGSIGFYAMEFDTMERHDMQIICVVANDSQWGMVKMAETTRNVAEVKKGYIATVLAPMREYHKLPEVWQGYGELVTDIKEIIPAIKRAYASGKPAIINVEVHDEYPCPFTVAYGCGG